MAETKTINLDVKTNIGSLRAQLQAAQREVYSMSEAFGATSREAADAAIKAASLKDAIEDAKNLTDAFNPDAKFNALSSSIGGVLNGFQAFEGAMGLLGVESEELQKTLLRVQSAMALSQGLQGLLEAKDSFVQLGAVAKNALSGIRAGIAATGIGLLVVALGTIVAYWDDIKSAVSGVSAEQAKLNEQTDANLLAQKAKYDAISGQDNILKLQGKSERDILKIKQTQIQAVIKATEAQLVQQEATKKAQIAAAKRNREILEGMITFITAPLQFVLKTIDLAGKALGKDFGLQKGLTKGLASLVFDPEEVKEEADKTIEETKNKLAQLRNEAAGFTNAINDMDKAEAKSSIDANKEKNDRIKNANAEAARLAIEQRNELDKKLEDIAEQNYQNSLSEQEREIRLIQDKYFELETLAQGNAQALQDIEIAKLNEINDVNLKYQQQAYEAEKAAKEKQKELDAKSNQDKIDAQKAVTETLATIRQEDFNNIQAGLDLISSLFENNKKVQAAVLVAENAVGIAKTIVNTQAANQLARAQGTALAIASGGASVAAAEALVLRNNIGAGISIASQIAATAKGLSALKAGGSPASGSVSGGGGGGGGMTPNFNVVGNSGMNQLAQIQQTPVQAYVVSGEVTSAQALDRNRVKNATL